MFLSSPFHDIPAYIHEGCDFPDMPQKEGAILQQPLSHYPIKAKCGRPDGTGQPQLHGNVTDRACQDVELMPSPVQRLQQHAC